MKGALLRALSLGSEPSGYAAQAACFLRPSAGRSVCLSAILLVWLTRPCHVCGLCGFRYLSVILPVYEMCERKLNLFTMLEAGVAKGNVVKFL